MDACHENVKKELLIPRDRIVDLFYLKYSQIQVQAVFYILIPSSLKEFTFSIDR